MVNLNDELELQQEPSQMSEDPDTMIIDAVLRESTVSGQTKQVI